MPIVRFICLLAVLAGVSLSGLDRANAEVSADVQQACTPDAHAALLAVHSRRGEDHRLYESQACAAQRDLHHRDARRQT